MPKCKEKDCTNERELKHVKSFLIFNWNVYHNWCSGHLCQYVDGNSEHCKEIARPNMHYCVGHKCRIDECDNIRNHICKNNDDTRSFIYTYCVLHECDNILCYNLKLPSNLKCLRCEERPCSVEGCRIGQRDKNSLYCEHHKCNKSDCDRKVCKDVIKKYNKDIAENNLKRHFYHYCEMHTCRTKGCLKYSLSHCSEHLCNLTGCRKNVVKNGYKYCKEHTCRTKGCSNLSSDYCENCNKSTTGITPC